MSDNNSTGGIRFVGLLTVLFVGLKLTEYIDWPWVWVLSPIWISIILGIVIIIIVLFVVWVFGR